MQPRPYPLRDHIGLGRVLQAIKDLLALAFVLLLSDQAPVQKLFELLELGRLVSLERGVRR